MRELELKYGCNPNQKPSRIFMEEGELPIRVLCGRPGYINFMDAFNGWQLVSELKKATGLPAATSFKHVSPAGAVSLRGVRGFRGGMPRLRRYFSNEWITTPERSFGSNHVVFGGIMAPVSAMFISCSMLTG